MSGLPLHAAKKIKLIKKSRRFEKNISARVNFVKKTIPSQPDFSKISNQSEQP